MMVVLQGLSNAHGEFGHRWYVEEPQRRKAWTCSYVHTGVGDWADLHKAT
jgi:hypothetical protein